MRFSRLPFAHWDSARLLCCGVGLMAVLLIESSGMGEMLDLQVTNWLFQYLGTRFKPSPQIVLVTIDDGSLQLMEPKIGRWPWPRSHLARLVQACEGAAGVGVDVLLLERDRFQPENDAVFAAAVRHHGRVALSGAFVDELVRGTPSLPPFVQRSLIPYGAATPHPRPQYLAQQFLAPLPVMGEAASRIGHANFFPARDHVLRSYSYLMTTDRGWMPSLAVATVKFFCVCKFEG